MARKLTRNTRGAVGYWGRDPFCRIAQEEVGAKVKVLLQDKLVAQGRRAALWLPVGDSDGLPCSCDKDTRLASDFRCFQCHGTRRVPGYLRFLHETVFFSSAPADVATFALTDVERDLAIKPNRLRLAPGALTGTVVTDDKPFSNPDGLDWGVDIVAFNKTATDLITVEFSTDAGLTYTQVADVNGPNKPTGNGAIRLRVTLSRVSTATDSPDFGIFRMRRPLPEFHRAAALRKDMQPGEILVLRTWAVEQAVRAVGMGRQVDFQSDKGWTAPLDFYDTRIAGDTPAARISDRGAGPHPFYARTDGILGDERFPMFQLSWNEEFLTFTHQAWFDRRAQPGELYHLVW